MSGLMPCSSPGHQHSLLLLFSFVFSSGSPRMAETTTNSYHPAFSCRQRRACLHLLCNLFAWHVSHCGICGPHFSNKKKMWPFVWVENTVSKEAMPWIWRVLWYFNCVVTFFTESKQIFSSFASSRIGNIQVSLVIGKVCRHLKCMWIHFSWWEVLLHILLLRDLQITVPCLTFVFQSSWKINPMLKCIII